ncbi:hypothetical protein DFR50_115120 [Roseiarcus fermentans]|uniref:Uncharacterized protein n=1 Tax=Roseiarcus fermentans TaxID=1473586 RepID=A0A366FBG8_9HYPH|nr:hypothetical protein [Roseiarcus fermentans]RBP12013.1 hypothetical protein DFR50_115120 [Roseiarcus fermentans]
METTAKPHEKQGEPGGRGESADGAQLPDRLKAPPTDARPAPDAVAHSGDRVPVADADRARAFENIKSAARFFGVAMQETDWRQLGRRPHVGRTAEDRKASARKAVTRKRGEPEPPET